MIGINSSYAQIPGANATTNCLPPTAVGTGYISGGFSATYPDGTNVYDLTNMKINSFTSCDPPPTNIGQNTTHTFGATVTGNLSVNGGSGQSIIAPAQVTVRTTKIGGADPRQGPIKQKCFSWIFRVVICLPVSCFVKALRFHQQDRQQFPTMEPAFTSTVSSIYSRN